MPAGVLPRATSAAILNASAASRAVHRCAASALSSADTSAIITCGQNARMTATMSISTESRGHALAINVSLLEGSRFAAQEFVRGKDAVTLPRDILARDDAGCRAAFRKSPMERATLRGLKRNAAVVIGDVGSADDIDVLTRSIGADEPFAHEHAMWALERPVAPE